MSISPQRGFLARLEPWTLAAIAVTVPGLWLVTRLGSDSGNTSAGHSPGGHSGFVTALGRDEFHVEAVFETDGVLRLYLLGRDETRVIDVEEQTLTAYVRSSAEVDSVPISLRPEPQAGDGPRRTSRFTGELPEGLVGQPVEITIPNLRIGEQRFRVAFGSQDHAIPEMPSKIVDDEERALYLTPGGVYTSADIEANGHQTASRKFRGFLATHDHNPQPGDRLCPITRTKANPACGWIINGYEYQFCCPPCVDEFVQLAKDMPDEIRPPEAYTKQ